MFTYCTFRHNTWHQVWYSLMSNIINAHVSHILFEFVHIQITRIAFETRTWIYFSSSHNASRPSQKTYFVHETFFSETLYLAVCLNNIYTVCYLFWNVQKTLKSNVPIKFAKWNVHQMFVKPRIQVFKTFKNWFWTFRENSKLTFS